jgi:hypothetical protein
LSEFTFFTICSSKMHSNTILPSPLRHSKVGVGFRTISTNNLYSVPVFHIRDTCRILDNLLQLTTQPTLYWGRQKTVPITSFPSQNVHMNSDCKSALGWVTCQRELEGRQRGEGLERHHPHHLRNFLRRYQYMSPVGLQFTIT